MNTPGWQHNPEVRAFAWRRFQADSSAAMIYYTPHIAKTHSGSVRGASEEIIKNGLANCFRNAWAIIEDIDQMSVLYRTDYDLDGTDDTFV